MALDAGLAEFGTDIWGGWFSISRHSPFQTIFFSFFKKIKKKCRLVQISKRCLYVEMNHLKFSRNYYWKDGIKYWKQFAEFPYLSWKTLFEWLLFLLMIIFMAQVTPYFMHQLTGLPAEFASQPANCASACIYIAPKRTL